MAYQVILAALILGTKSPFGLEAIPVEQEQLLRRHGAQSAHQSFQTGRQSPYVFIRQS